MIEIGHKVWEELLDHRIPESVSLPLVADRGSLIEADREASTPNGLNGTVAWLVGLNNIATNFIVPNTLVIPNSPASPFNSTLMKFSSGGIEWCLPHPGAEAEKLRCMLPGGVVPLVMVVYLPVSSSLAGKSGVELWNEMTGPNGTEFRDWMKESLTKAIGGDDSDGAVVVLVDAKADLTLWLKLTTTVPVDGGVWEASELKDHLSVVDDMELRAKFWKGKIPLRVTARASLRLPEAVARSPASPTSFAWVDKQGAVVEDLFRQPGTMVAVPTLSHGTVILPCSQTSDGSLKDLLMDGGAFVGGAGTGSGDGRRSLSKTERTAAAMEAIVSSKSVALPKSDVELAAAATVAKAGPAPRAVVDGVGRGGDRHPPLHTLTVLSVGEASIDGATFEAPYVDVVSENGKMSEKVYELELDVVAYVSGEMGLNEALFNAIVPCAKAQARACLSYALLMRVEDEAELPVVRASHFLPPASSSWFNLVTLLQNPLLKESSATSVAGRVAAHLQTHLGLTRPAFRFANAFSVPGHGESSMEGAGSEPLQSGGGGGGRAEDGSGRSVLEQADAWALASKWYSGSAPKLGPETPVRGEYVKRLLNVHQALGPGPYSSDPSTRTGLVDGSYAFFHYGTDGESDSGWGCAYRSLQTIGSWLQLQGFTAIRPPSLSGIQQALVAVGDKPKNWAGTRGWIGAVEVAMVLDAMYKVPARILNVTSGSALREHSRTLLAHFAEHGSPIMIGGGVLAYTILGVQWNDDTGDVAYLILDPHYVGSDESKRIVSKGAIAWHGPSLFRADAFYNLCLPQRPYAI